MSKIDHLKLENVSGDTALLQIFYLCKLVTKMSQWNKAIRYFLGRFRMYLLN